MTLEEWERVVRQSKFTLLPKRFTPRGNILLAERYFNFHPEYPKPHWQVVWSIERDGPQIGQKLFFDFGVTSDERKSLVLGVVNDFLTTHGAVEAGEYERDARGA